MGASLRSEAKGTKVKTTRSSLPGLTPELPGTALEFGGGEDMAATGFQQCEYEYGTRCACEYKSLWRLLEHPRFSCEQLRV